VALGGPSLLRFSALDRDGLFFHPGRRRPTQCRACRAPRSCRLANLFAAAHTRVLRLDHSAAWSVKTLPRCNPTRLPSRVRTSRLTSCDACRARGGARSVPRASSLGSGGFAATGPRPASLHRDDSVLVFPNTAVSARPPFTPAYLIDGGRFFGPDAASRLLQRVFKLRRTSTCPRALPSHTAGGCPACVAVHDALFTLPAPSSLNAKTIRARCTAASYAFSPTPGLETRTPKAVTFAPVSDTFRWAHETWETRRPEERSEGEPLSLAGCADPLGLAPRGPSSIAPPNPSCHRRCVRDGMEARSRAGTRPHHPPRPSFRSPSREGLRHSEDRGAFHRGNRATEGIAPWMLDRPSPLRSRDSGFAT